MKVLVVSPGLAKRLSDVLPDEIEVVYPERGTDDELEALAVDVEVIVSTRLSASVARAAKNLKLLQKTGAGVDDMPFDALGDDAYMANTSGSNPVPLAEGAVALVLALAKRVVERNSRFLEGRGVSSGVLLKGKSAGILGLGSIGVEVAKMLQGFDMRILGLKRDPSVKPEGLNLDFLGGPGDLHRFMEESDFVISTLPLTVDTRGIIGEKELRLMKPTAYIVSVSRAAVIEEEPLYRALKEGWIAGAALDVWWRPHFWDPIWNPEGKGASEYPFWELPNVICTPHSITSTDSRSDASLKIMAENIRRIADGRPPINQVDKRLQY